MIIVFLCLYSFQRSGLSAKNPGIYYNIEGFGSVSSGEYTPFWIVSNNWGIVPLKSGNAYLKAGIFQDKVINKDWSYSLGLDMAVSSQHVYNTFWIQELYGELNWKFIRLNIGSKEDYISLLDKNLSSGDFSYSQNMRPVPEIKLSIPDFVAIPYTGKFLSIKGDFAFGQMNDGEYLENTADPNYYNFSKNPLLHHKSFYLKIGNIEENISAFQFIAGINHMAMQGGDIYISGRKMNFKNVGNRFSQIIFPGGKNQGNVMGENYAEGSHSGDYLFMLNYKKQEQVYSLYLSHFFEDGSGLEWENYPDMMLGVQYKTNKQSFISGALIEYIYTKNQSGPVQLNITENGQIDLAGVDGDDDYYNNYLYAQGKSYFGRSMGNPLFLSPEYNGDGRLYFKDNRFVSWHMGLEGFINPQLTYRFLATYIESLGRYDLPHRNAKKGFASAVDVTRWNILSPGWDIQLSLGLDQGKFFGNSLGAALTIRKRGVI